MTTIPSNARPSTGFARRIAALVRSRIAPMHPRRSVRVAASDRESVRLAHDTRHDVERARAAALLRATMLMRSF